MPSKPPPFRSSNPPAGAPTFTTVPLTFCEVRFCNFHLDHDSATQAARAAGDTSASDGALRYSACKLVVKPNVAEYLRKASDTHLPQLDPWVQREGKHRSGFEVGSTRNGRGNHLRCGEKQTNCEVRMNFEFLQ